MAESLLEQWLREKGYEPNAPDLMIDKCTGCGKPGFFCDRVAVRGVLRVRGWLYATAGNPALPWAVLYIRACSADCVESAKRATKAYDAQRHAEACAAVDAVKFERAEGSDD